MSLNLKEDIEKAAREAGHTPPNKGSNVYQGCSTPGLHPLTMTCHFMTPCGWCCKWDKPCDKKMGGGNDIKPRKKKDKTLEMIKSGKGLPPIGNSEKGIR